jgi:nucleoside-diphosphate-sugar epimerase
VLGAAGFVGNASTARLAAAGVETIGLSRAEVDLLAPGAAESLKKRLRPGDTLIFISAHAPCKNAAMLVENVRMAETVSAAIKELPIAHLIYVSSDAVYKDSQEPLTEAACAEPASTHGAMHLAREVILRSEFQGPLGILRPTLIYGLADPHNGYGPNRFRRLASEGKPITLFGEGEERRDHVSINDVAELVARMAMRRSEGILNAVSGDVVSFRDLAVFTANQFRPKVSVINSARSGSMPHNGMRPFAPAGITSAFVDFRITPWQEGIAAMCRSTVKEKAL